MVKQLSQTATVGLEAVVVFHNHI